MIINKNVLSGYIFGFRTIIYLSNSLRDDEVKDLIDMAHKKSLPIDRVDKHQLNVITNNGLHQGKLLLIILLKVSFFVYISSTHLIII